MKQINFGTEGGFDYACKLFKTSFSISVEQTYNNKCKINNIQCLQGRQLG
jgi:hypothetical protein